LEDTAVWDYELPHKMTTEEREQLFKQIFNINQ